MEFKQLGINESILKVLQEQQYSVPTPIQEKTIPSALAGHDILGLAQTGTGKTAAFSVPTLQILANKKKQNGKRGIRALILTPTRELALQVYTSFTVYGRYLPLKSTVIFGGVGQDKQVKALKGNVDILVATPGRLQDLMGQGHIDISTIDIFILDEADRMLDMGFIHDVQRIIKFLPVKKQTMLFSATMPKGMQGIVDKLLVNPVEVSVSPVSSTVELIEQSVYYVDQAHKIDILTDLLRTYKNEPTLVFTRTKGGTDRVVKHLGRRNIKAQGIHGGKSQNARQNALTSFKNGEICALVATDIASRGIDISELKHVINYDLPEVPETYVHRIGRTGRAGNEGMAVSFCSYQEKDLLKDIEKLIRKNITVMENTKYPMIDTTVKEKATQTRRPRKPEKEVSNRKDVADKRDATKRKDAADKRDATKRKDAADKRDVTKRKDATDKREVTNRKDITNRKEAVNKKGAVNKNDVPRKKSQAGNRDSNKLQTRIFKKS